MKTRNFIASAFGLLMLLIAAGPAYGQQQNFAGYGNQGAPGWQPNVSNPPQHIALGQVPINANMASCQPNCGNRNCGNLACRRPGPVCPWYISYENVIVKPHFSRNAAYFIEDPGTTDGYLEVPLDWDYTYSPRFEIGKIPDCGDLGARLRYWHFDGDVSVTANDPNGDIFVGFAEDSIGDIGLFGVDDALFTHDLQMDVVDAEFAFRQRLWTYSAGLRWARMEQSYDGTELNVLNGERFQSGHDFDGYGVTVAVEVVKPFRRCLSVFAKARGSFLYGQSGFFAVNPDEDDQLINVNGDDLLSASELQVGFHWRKQVWPGRTFYVTLAAEGQYWNNGGTGAPTNNAPYDEGNYQNAHPQDADLGFFGLNIGTGILY